LKENMEYFAGSCSTPRAFFYHVVKFGREELERVHVNGGGFIGTSKYFWKTRGNPDIVINGDEGFYEKSPVLPKGYGVSDGQIYKNMTVESCVQWDKSHQLLGMSDRLLPGAFNVCGGSNVLLSYGEIPEWLDGKPSVDPRTSLFWDDTHYYIIMIDGRNNGTLGLRLAELAEFALSLGATDGHNFDGGDSCQLLLNENGIPIIKNNLPDGKLHSVVNHIGFWLKDGATVPEMPAPVENPEGDEEVINGLAKEKLGKTMSVRNVPAVESGSKVGEIAPRTEFEFVEIAPDLNHPTDAAYQWLKLTDGNYVNYIYPPNGERVDILRMPDDGEADPEPARKIVDIDVNYDDGTRERFYPKP